MKALYSFLLFVLLSSSVNAQKTDEQWHQLADKLSHKYIITDGHVDLPYRLKIKNFRLERQYMDIRIRDRKSVV